MSVSKQENQLLHNYCKETVNKTAEGKRSFFRGDEEITLIAKETSLLEISPITPKFHFFPY